VGALVQFLDGDVYLAQSVFVCKLENKLNLSEANRSSRLLNSPESLSVDLSVTHQRAS
jgi:hypothetical protein